MIAAASNSDRTRLLTDLLGFIETADLDARESSLEPFESLALRLFAYQYERNEPYRRLCQRQGKTPGTVQRWQEIPAVATASFKHVSLFCGDPEEAVAVFHTSGTTEGKPGVHRFRTLVLYRTAALRTFRWACMPDVERLPMLILGPTIEHFPNSSLGQMYSWLREACGTADSRVCFFPDRLDAQAAQAWLLEQALSQRPVMILATSLALWQFVHTVTLPSDFRLPEGSRILDTGGYKGRRLGLARHDYESLVAQKLGLHPEWLFNEYGMTEMSSQYYESRFLTARFGRRAKYGPPWLRSFACDPHDLRPVVEGQTGVLRHCDLANLDSVIMLQTEDLGRFEKDALFLEGRTPGAEPRGCSLLVEDLIRNT